MSGVQRETSITVFAYRPTWNSDFYFASLHNILHDLSITTQKNYTVPVNYGPCFSDKVSAAAAAIAALCARTVRRRINN